MYAVSRRLVSCRRRQLFGRRVFRLEWLFVVELLLVVHADGRREALGLDPCITADTPSEPTSSYKNKPNGPPRWWEGGESRLRMLF